MGLFALYGHVSVIEENILLMLQATGRSLFTNHSQEHSLSQSQMFVNLGKKKT